MALHRENSTALGVSLLSRQQGTFDVALDAYFQNDDDFQKSIELWQQFPEVERTMETEDLRAAHLLLPDVSISTLARVKTKCNKPCCCGRESNALDLISFCIRESIHGASFLTRVFNEDRKDKKISIMDSMHRNAGLPSSVVYIDDTKPIPCLNCGDEIHLYLLHDSLAHYWHG